MLHVRLPDQYFDAESGNHYNYYRDYDPSLGRYVQSDPIGLGGGVNTYLYALANPVRYFDIDGLRPTKDPKGPDGMPITHSCRKTCIVDFIGGNMVTSALGLGAGGLITRSSLSVGFSTGASAGIHVAGKISDIISLHGVIDCLKECDEEICE